VSDERGDGRRGHDPSFPATRHLGVGRLSRAVAALEQGTATRADRTVLAVTAIVLAVPVVAITLLTLLG
jgi:hypothetical protein